jgi:hypothetical protein
MEATEPPLSRSFEVDLTGQLSNLPGRLVKLLAAA